MSSRITIERILRDNDDDSGQTIRDWTIQCDAGFVVVKMKFGNGFISMRPEDVDVFVADMKRSKEIAQSLAEDQSRG